MEFFPYAEHLDLQEISQKYNLDVFQKTGLLKVHMFLCSSQVTGLLFQVIYSQSLKQPGFLLLHATGGAEGEDIFVLF